MAGEKGVRLPLTRATETQGAYTTEPTESNIKESPAAKVCAVVAERDEEKERVPTQGGCMRQGECMLCIKNKKTNNDENKQKNPRTAGIGSLCHGMR